MQLECESFVFAVRFLVGVLHMSQYVHHVPGRIRVRSKAFRCHSEKAFGAQKKLLSTVGVQKVRVNSHAGSITVNYDPAVVKQSHILAVLEQVGCMGASTHNADGARFMGEMFGKALVGAVVRTAVERSARSLVGAII